MCEITMKLLSQFQPNSPQMEILSFHIHRFFALFPERSIDVLMQPSHSAILSFILSVDSSLHASVLGNAFSKRFCSLPAQTSMASYFNSPAFADVVLVLGPEQLRVPAHRVVLSNCKYFQSLFSSGMVESQQSIVPFLNFHPEPFMSAIQYLYDDSFQPSGDFEFVKSLMEIADYLGLEQLVTRCEMYVCTLVTAENVAYIMSSIPVAIEKNQPRVSPLALKCRDVIISSQSILRSIHVQDQCLQNLICWDLSFTA
jgi:hypothetical protein